MTIFKRFFKDEKGAVNEFLGFILFLAIIFMVLVPLMIELLAYTGQAQEVDRITKIAAKRACTLLAKPTIGVAGDLKQGSLGMATDISVMQPMVNSIFRNETSDFASYSQNFPDGVNADLRVFDVQGNQIDIAGDSNRVEIQDPDGRKASALLVATNPEASLCPSGTSANGWKYCMEGGDEAIKQNLQKTGQSENQDLIQRMQLFQAGRCRQGEDCSGIFQGYVDRCTVCATKTRQSIFGRVGFFGPLLMCNSVNDGRIIPCKISACATEKLVKASTKRGYNPAYQDERNLGSQFTAKEVNYGEAQSANNTILKEATNQQRLTRSSNDSNDPNAKSKNYLFDQMDDVFNDVNDTPDETKN